jgi:ribosomal protein S18 acetylase RimI-like enzyme
MITARQQEDAMVVDRLYARPPCQRRGVGQQLLESSYRAFPSVRRVRLRVEEKNPKRMAFYRKQGFREVDRLLEEVAGNRLETVVMEKQL